MKCFAPNFVFKHSHKVNLIPVYFYNFPCKKLTFWYWWDDQVIVHQKLSVVPELLLRVKPGNLWKTGFTDLTIYNEFYGRKHFYSTWNNLNQPIDFNQHQKIKKRWCSLQHWKIFIHESFISTCSLGSYGRTTSESCPVNTTFISELTLTK